MVARSKKVTYFAHLEKCLREYSRAFLVDVDFVGSKQISDIRIALRGKAELVFGKNTMIRRCIKNMCADGDHPEWECLLPYMVGNVGYIFTNGELDSVDTVIREFVKPAAAKAGVIAPVSVTIPKGPTGLDPAQTSFFQALNIATKINKGSIEIISDCKVITEGNKVKELTHAHARARDILAPTAGCPAPASPGAPSAPHTRTLHAPHAATKSVACSGAPMLSPPSPCTAVIAAKAAEAAPRRRRSASMPARVPRAGGGQMRAGAQ